MYRDPSSGLHNLPAWSTTEEGDIWNRPSPGNSDSTGDEKIVNDVWFAPPTQFGRRKRSPLNNRRGPFDEEREISPGTTSSANLKSYKSAPQLVQQEKPRVTSADHRAKLEDLLFEMGWPKEEEVAEGSEGSQSHQGRPSGGSGSSGSGGSSVPASSSGSNFSTGAGSLASGMPVTSALFQRRAANMKEGDRPAPSQVAIPASDEVTKGLTAPIAMTSLPSVNVDYRMRPAPEQPHCRSATFPSAHNTLDPSIMSRPAYQPSVSAASLPTSHMFHQQQQQQQFLNQDVNARQQGQAALFFELASRTTIPSFAQQQAIMTQSPFPSIASSSISSASTSTADLQTPITPFQNMSTNEVAASSMPYGYSPMSTMGALPNQLLTPHSMAYPTKVKTQSDLDINGTYGNALGLQYIVPPLNQSTNMIDSSSYSQIFSGMSTFSTSQPSLKQMRSSPNMRVSPSSEGSPLKSPLRKIASNRRLTINSSDNLSNMPSSPTKSPIKKNKSPKTSSYGIIPLPPMPSLMSTASSGSHNGGAASFEFVNYGIHDADELCSAVAPSGSYKVPLKGFGSNIDDQEDDEDQDDTEGDAAANDAAEKRLHRSRSKSNSRLGPRWQGVDGEDDEISSGNSEKSLSRHIKRRKSEVNMLLSSPGKKKTASSGNLRRRD